MIVNIGRLHNTVSLWTGGWKMGTPARVINKAGGRASQIPSTDHRHRDLYPGNLGAGSRPLPHKRPADESENDVDKNFHEPKSIGYHQSLFGLYLKNSGKA